VCAFIGTYLYHDDPIFVGLYRHFQQACICCGQGGMQFLLPYALLTFINSAIDSIQLLRIFSTFGMPILFFKYGFVPSFLVWLEVLIWVAETSGCILTGIVLKNALGSGGSFGDDYFSMSGGQGSGGGSMFAPSRDPDSHSDAASRPATTMSQGQGQGRSQGFTAFSGQGHTLGAWHSHTKWRKCPPQDVFCWAQTATCEILTRAGLLLFVAVTNTFLWWMFSLACHLLQLFNSVLVWQVPEGPCKQCHAYTVISLTVCIMIYASSSTIKTATLTVALCSIMHVVCMCMVWFYMWCW